MAAAPQRNIENTYQDGGGFGKFRKRPFRRVSTTPYDRPPTAIRNPSLSINNNYNTNGWLSKIVDPAQRLITSGAHKLFGNIFRKRLPPPPPAPPLVTEENGGAVDAREEAVGKDPLGVQVSGTNDIDPPASISDRGRLTELELMLKQKTFTRSEIDQLTALLHSRSVDQPVGNEDKKNDVLPSRGELAHDREEVFMSSSMKDNELDGHHMSTPIFSSRVLDEDAASPAELAKAYMGSRPSKISSSVLGLSSQPRENAGGQVNYPFASKSNVTSVVPRSSRSIVPYENRFVTPRSRGRSAIYSMARTPYSRSHQTSQGAGAEVDVLSTPPSISQSTWESGRFNGSKQGALKRRSSVLDNDIGSVGPIRRIRQKSNLLVSSAALSGHTTGVGSIAVEHPSLVQKQVLGGEPSIGNGDSSRPGPGINSVPSKSSAMASKILQQLDVLVSTRDKLPTKLSPSMLRGPALRSLEDVDTSKLLEAVQDNNKLDVKCDNSLPDTRDSVSNKQDKVEENGSAKLIAFHDKPASTSNGFDPTSVLKTNACDVVKPFETNSVVHFPSQKKRAFQMSAHEDFVELDDDDHSDRVAPSSLSNEKEKRDTAVAENKTSPAQAITVEKPSEFSRAKPHAGSVFGQNPPGTSDGFTVAEKSTAVTNQNAPLSGITVQHPEENKQPVQRSDRISSLKESKAPPVFSFNEKALSTKEPNGFPPSNISTKSEDTAPQMTFASSLPALAGSTTPTFGISSDSKSENSSSLTFSAADATRPLMKEPESGAAANKSNMKSGVFSGSTEAASSAASMSSPSANFFSFGLPNDVSSVNGSLASGPSFSPSIPALVSQTSSKDASSSYASATFNTSDSTTASTSTTSFSNSSSLSLPASSPSFLSTTAFKFSAPTISSTSTSLASVITAVEPIEDQRNGTSSANLTNAPFGSASFAVASLGGSLLSDPSSAVKSTVSSTLNATSSSFATSGTSATFTNLGNKSTFNFNTGASNFTSTTNQSQGFNPFSAASTQASASSTAFSTSQSMPTQFGSTASSPFGFTANTALSSGSSLFGSSSSAGSLFSSGGSFGLTATSDAKPVSSTTGTTSSPVFSFGATSTFSTAPSSTAFVFGATSASNPVSSSPMMFGSSPSTTSGSVFNFSSAASATQVQPSFASPSAAPAFASSPSGEQMNMEDSMAEDTVQAATAPVFGQQTVTPPSSGFVFGSSTPTGANQFVPTPVQQASNPFQFGSQPNLAAPQNQSPFQVSNSLDFNAGGSFSLGTGGDKSNRKFVRVSRKTQRKK